MEVIAEFGGQILLFMTVLTSKETLELSVLLIMLEDYTIKNFPYQKRYRPRASSKRIICFVHSTKRFLPASPDGLIGEDNFLI
jgi:hypothetical protein